MSNINLFISVHEHNYIMSKAFIEDFPKLEKMLSEPLFTISDLGVTPRDATYWDKQGILPELLGKGARRKYTLTQSVWIRLIIQMRRMNVAVPVIKSFKEKLFETAVDVAALMESPEAIALLQAALDKQGIKKDIKELLKEQSIQDSIANSKVGMLEGLIISTITLKKKIQLLVGLGGDYMPYSVDKHDVIIKELPITKEFMEAPHYSLSLWVAHLELLLEWRDKPFFEDASLLSDEEHKIIKAIREPNVISVKVKKINGDLDLLEKTVEGKVDLASRFMDVIIRNGYQNIEIKTRNGNIVHYENRILEKLKSTK
jgi:DNA-binding transcriptional MerR regulator